MEKNATETYGMLQTAIETISAQFDVSVGTEDAEELREVCPKGAQRRSGRWSSWLIQIPQFLMLWWPALKAGSTAMIQRPRDRVPSGSMLALPDQEGQTEQIHLQNFDDPFFWQHWHDLHALGSHWTDSQQGILCWGFKGVQEEIPSEEASTLQIGSGHFHQNNAPVHNSILVVDYLSKWVIKTVLQPPYSPDLAPLWLLLIP